MKTKLTVGAAVVALVLSVLAITNKPVKQVIERVVEKQIGAVPGNSVDGREWSVGGVNKIFDSQNFKSATSTFCVIKPPTATSTLIEFTAKNTSATSTTVLYVLEKRTNGYAPLLSVATSTDVIASATLSASDDATFRAFATSSPVQGAVGGLLSVNDLLEITPSQYLVFYGKNGGGGSINQATSIGTVFSGQCNATLQEVQ